MTLLEKLDLTLNFFALTNNRDRLVWFPDVMTGLIPLYPNRYDDVMQHFELRRIFEKLEEDKFIDYTPFPQQRFGDELNRVMEGRFQITFRGLLWLEKGGYQGEVDRNSQMERRLKIAHNLQYILAVGVSTPFLWYLHDLLKHYLYIPFGIKECLILMVFGSGVGIIILLTIQE